MHAYVRDGNRDEKGIKKTRKSSRGEEKVLLSYQERGPRETETQKNDEKRLIHARIACASPDGRGKPGKGTGKVPIGTSLPSGK